MRIYFLLVLFLFAAVQSQAQTQFTGWLASFNTFKIGKKTSVHADVQLRSADQMERIQTLLLRAGLNFNVNKQLVLTGGYAYIHSYKMMNGVDGYVPEHRIWEQMIFNHKWKQVTFSHRFRIEQRFLPKTFVQNNELAHEGSEYANRFRYFLRNIIPFRKQQTFEKGLFGAVQNEVFLNFGNTSTVNGKTFDQNRAYLAIGYRINKGLDIEAGYVNQYVSGKGDAFTNNHVAQVAVYLRK